MGNLGRPASIPVWLEGGGGPATEPLRGSVGPHRPPRKTGGHWSWRLVWREANRQKQRAIGRIDEGEAVSAADRVWRAVVKDEAARCTRARTRIRTRGTNGRTQKPVRVKPASPTPKNGADGDSVSVDVLLDAFVAWHHSRPARVRRSPRTLREYANRCSLLSEVLGDVPLGELTEDDCEHAVEAMLSPALRAIREARFDAARVSHQTSGPRARGRGYSVNVVNQALEMFAIALTWGGKRGWAVPRVDAKAARIRGGAQPEDRVYRHHTPEDTQVADLVADLKPSSVRRAILLCWRCGARQGELAALRWKDLVRAPAGSFVLIGENPDADGHRKNRARPVRRVAVSAEVAAAIEAERPARVRDSARIAPGGNWAGRMVQVQARRGVPHDEQFTPHGLRRRFCSNLLDAGASIGLYVDQTGHSPRVALQVYYRATDRRRQSLVLGVEGLASGIALMAVVAELGITLDEAVRRVRAGGEEVA